MKAINVKPGEVYAVKVSGKICPVRLDRVHHAIPGYAGGWWGTNLNTGRAVRIKTAAKLRYLAPAFTARGPQPRTDR